MSMNQTATLRFLSSEIKFFFDCQKWQAEESTYVHRISSCQLLPKHKDFLHFSEVNFHISLKRHSIVVNIITILYGKFQFYSLSFIWMEVLNQLSEDYWRSWKKYLRIILKLTWNHFWNAVTWESVLSNDSINYVRNRNLRIGNVKIYFALNHFLFFFLSTLSIS